MGKTEYVHTEAEPFDTPLHDGRLIAALCQLATQVQRERTLEGILETAGRGVAALGMRLAAFQVVDEEAILRAYSTTPTGQAHIEAQVGRPLRGLRAPFDRNSIPGEVLGSRAPRYCEDLDPMECFLRAAGHPCSTGSPSNGVVAPLFIRDQPWGFLVLVSPALTRLDAPAVSLFAAQIASALEVAESIGALERLNRALAACYQDLARAQEELVNRERLAALGELAAIMAHEVRNPLAVLFNSLSSLKRMIQAARQGDGLEGAEMLLSIASEESDRLNRIVTDLLDFARPQEPRFMQNSLPELVQEVVADALKDPSAREVSIRTQLDPDVPFVEMDGRMVRRALLNVLLNGMQAMPHGGRLRIRIGTELRNEVRFALIEVTDTGGGIPPEVEGRIFEPFFTTKAFGTGLGLTVVKRTLEAHRGEVRVHSSPGGTRLTLGLPVTRAEAPTLRVA